MAANGQGRPKRGPLSPPMLTNAGAGYGPATSPYGDHGLGRTGTGGQTHARSEKVALRATRTGQRKAVTMPVATGDGLAERNKSEGKCRGGLGLSITRT